MCCGNCKSVVAFKSDVPLVKLPGEGIEDIESDSFINLRAVIAAHCHDK